ncbi:class I SAM-dependent methyltransferase [Nonomuraea gerenzanensis]|uniref:Probable methyltransferase n=1 Tax=Nonomuraea gerenzanensis TaxID=93944 RepID=A0A1M4EKY9_9ACTN|nr:methyltransferase domain-containing protein [Nonomuraea gerenzanensis]UBU10800.1 methyltransferase domain-containing protein [Nonomuraea gerenzanensis]SBO99233.1 probable methyltransferase [Nonomuraea gerenzanensis]
MPRQSEFQHPRFAQAYARVAELVDRRGAYEHRRRLLAGAGGRVIEVGAGNGRNFAHYPPGVTEVVAVEPDDTLRELATAQAASAPVPVSVVSGHAEALPGGDGAFDVVVVSLVLCSVPSQPRALAEAARVLRPGGQLRFYEHVRPANPAFGLLADVVSPLWRRVAGGCRPNRDTLAAIGRAGFEVVETERFGFAPQPGMPRLTHVLGYARR